MGVFMLPPSKGNCLVCARNHKADEPHDADSMYYQVKFTDAHGRAPTWYDACAHFDAEKQELCIEVAKDTCAQYDKEFRELPEGAKPIAEPYRTTDDQIGNPAVTLNIEPICFAMDGSYVHFNVRIAGRTIEDTKKEITKNLEDADIEADLWAFDKSIQEAQDLGIKKIMVKWTRETGEIEAIESKEK